MVEPFKKKALLTDREKGYWEETFLDHKDSKPHGEETGAVAESSDGVMFWVAGSSSVGVDISIIGMKFAYGIPEHAESYALRDTK